MEVKGTIERIEATQTISEKFSKREFVVKTNEQYPQSIMMEFTQDKCEILDKYKVGQSVKASINLRGRNWTNPSGVVKTFNTLQAWRIEEATQTEQVKPVSADDMPF